MTTGLGYGSGLVLRQTVRNNSATVAISVGQVVKIIDSGIGASGVGDEVLLAEVATVADEPGRIGIAESDMGVSGAAGEGEWGHVITFGLTKVLASAALLEAGDAIAVDALGVIDQAAGAQVTAGDAVGIALQGNGSLSVLVTAFVNFLSRGSDSGYGGTAT